jgi:hypothetical protein
MGSYLPFARTATQRHHTGDPRPAVSERYRSRFDYITRIVRAAQALVVARLLLEEDVERYVERAIQETGW